MMSASSGINRWSGFSSRQVRYRGGTDLESLTIFHTTLVCGGRSSRREHWPKSRARAPRGGCKESWSSSSRAIASTSPFRALIGVGYQYHLVFLWLPSADFAVARVG